MHGVELQVLVPRLEDVSRVQRRGDEGAAQERFASQLNQEVEQRRQTVPETEKARQERIDNSAPREEKQRRQENGRRRPGQKARQETAAAAPEKGRRLDVRA